MSTARPEQIWWTAAEIAQAGLPGLPGTRRGVDDHAKRQGWREQSRQARRRKGRGGGWEYSWELMPLRARRKLLRDAAPVSAPPAPDADERDARHAYFESLPEAGKDKARTRLRILHLVQAMERAGVSRYLAVEAIAEQEGIAARTCWNWLAMVDQIAAHDWLYYLAPRNRAATRQVKRAPKCTGFMTRLKADYLRLERPSFASCYRRCTAIARKSGLDWLPERTARRRLGEEVPRVSQVFARQGYIGLARCFPPQTRDRSDMVALEGVNADCHKFDVFVEWPDGTIDRPQIAAFQDLYSNKMLSWRIDHSPNKVAVMAAFGELVDTWGIPQHCLFDNGMEFANKWMTGGVPTRFRYKIRADDPIGVLPLLGITVHWATPAHGQAKPIERAFRDFADDIAKDPRFAGAWVGNRPDAKPENYASRAVPLETFVRVVAEGIAEHNARAGRLTVNARGRSFDETFAESYARAPIRKATAEQRRLWLMGQEIKTLRRGHGLVRLHGNEYWSDWMNEFAGQKVAVRFDPEDLHAGVHIYNLDGEFLGFAACKDTAGFFDLTDAKDHARRSSAIKRAERRLLEKLRPMKVSELGTEMDDLAARAPTAPHALEAKVVSPVFGRAPSAPLVERPRYQDDVSPEDAARQAALVVEFEAARGRAAEASQEIDDPLERFRRALEIERRAAAGGRIDDEEHRWLTGYQTTGEYRGQARMYEGFGDRMFLN